jgi:hypothetical protein
MAAMTAEAQPRDTRTWYQAYGDAQQNISRGNWQAALNDLDAAQRLNPPSPGRNVNFYGDVYRDYNPDYYRGVALTNLKRFEEADQAFERVRQAKLIGPRDALNTEFTRLSQSVKEAVTNLAAQRNPPATPVQTAPETITATNLPPPGAAPVPPSEANAPVAPLASGAVNPAPTAPVSTVPAPRPGTPSQTRAAEAAAEARAIEADRRNQLALTAANRRAPAGVNAERDAIVRYFSGDYAAAFEALRGVANTDAATPRTYLFLACSEAALVLTGRSQAGMAEARALVPRIGDRTALARDLALISPRIRTELGLQP